MSALVCSLLLMLPTAAMEHRQTPEIPTASALEEPSTSGEVEIPRGEKEIGPPVPLWAVEKTRGLQKKRRERNKKKKKKKKGGGGSVSGPRIRLIFDGDKTNVCMEARSISNDADVYTARCSNSSKQQFKKEGSKIKIGSYCLGYSGMWLKIKSCSSSSTSWSWSAPGQMKAKGECATQRHEPGFNERCKLQDCKRAQRHKTDKWDDS
eukprot:CAMPEP_0183310048 /NCGR_PEP_ID=MMETSP0160_2-20130417/28552_1 /TAXON_ID=2839 ORGANISM="Odontella Sinensis, Strain Grunow 1884" /NCGR_SAMPLE_ID=MMETSP0160_2 /ASSEMBLY_ACC=CAM_ASM_000250 /LENGTH=207 /DNA_ID=CAMNT_0025474191 /DNA_START=137 /DNA_END=760 /DNA_ORIENTATION=+